MATRVQSGLEVLAAQSFKPLNNQRIGLITNPTGVLPNLRSTIDELHSTSGVRLRALFGPEHGVRGDATAGSSVASGHDAQTGLPVYSLYGRTRVPTAAMLSGLDVLVFDIQDIGSRSYTYLSTLGSVMEGASAHKIPLIVLDRPNPLGGERVEGSPTERGFTSFVGKYPVSYCHGMTLGELARMINGMGWLPGGRHCELTVIPCANLTRALASWDAMGGLPWVPTSPHVPHPITSQFYAATGIVGELTTLSIGVGYTLPFEMAGAPGIDPVALFRALNRHTRRDLNGFRFRPVTWTPFYATHKGENCGGVQIYLDDPAHAPLTRLNFEILDALRAVGKRSLFTGGEATKMFDLSCGTDRIRKAYVQGASGGQMWEIWNAGRDTFARARRPYLIYR